MPYRTPPRPQLPVTMLRLIWLGRSPPAGLIVRAPRRRPEAPPERPTWWLAFWRLVALGHVAGFSPDEGRRILADLGAPSPVRDLDALARAFFAAAPEATGREVLRAAVGEMQAYPEGGAPPAFRAAAEARVAATVPDPEAPDATARAVPGHTSGGRHSSTLARYGITQL